MSKRHLKFEAIGTRWEIVTENNLPETAWVRLRQAISERIEEFDKTYSRFRADSLVTRMSQRAGRYALPADAYPLLRFYEQLYRLTKGKITPLIGQVMSDAGYDADYSLQPKKLRPAPAWEYVIRYGKQHIELSRPALLDFGAAGKGCLVDIIGELLEAADIRDYYVNAGGDIRYRTSGPDPLRVGLENPQDSNEVLGMAMVHNQSICASSGSRRAWDRYHHLIDPAGLESPREILSTWVMAKGTMTADGLATALFFAEPETLRAEFPFAYTRLRPDMSMERSANMTVKLFEAEPLTS